MCQDAGYHADTDARKWDRFRRGLNTKLKERLNLVRADNFNELVNMAITQEDCISAHRVQKKRKTPTKPSNAQPPRYRLVQNTTTRAPPRIIDSQSSEIQPDLSYTEHPIKVLDTKKRSTRRETIRMFKIQWDHHTEEEATWKTESYLQRNFSDFLQANSQI
jgi:hypothetical protein